MLLSVRWRAVLLGLGVGVLTLAAGAVVIWLALAVLGVEGAAGAATTFGVLGGMAASGWIAGRQAPYSPWFHGAIAALMVAAAVVATAIVGGSPAPILQVLLLSFLAIALGAGGGHFGGRSIPRQGDRR